MSENVSVQPVGFAGSLSGHKHGRDLPTDKENNDALGSLTPRGAKRRALANMDDPESAPRVQELQNAYNAFDAPDRSDLETLKSSAVEPDLYVALGPRPDWVAFKPLMFPPKPLVLCFQQQGRGAQLGLQDSERT